MCSPLVITLVGSLLFPLLPSSTLQPPPGKQGLRGEYFYGAGFIQKVFTRIDPQLDFHWDAKHPPANQLDPVFFSVRWRGQLYAPASGLYYFSARADDGVRLRVGENNVLDQWPPQPVSVGDCHRVSIYLQANQWYAIQVEYVNNWADCVLQLYWELPFDTHSELGSQGAFAKIIPARYLSPLTKPTTSAGPPKKPSITTLTNQDRPKRPKGSTKTAPGLSKPIAVRLHTPIEDGPKRLTGLAPLPIERGKVTLLPSVQFAQSSYELLTESYGVLKQVVQALQQDTTRRIEIRGHTDNVGNVGRNVTLSEYRARQVAQYLISQGVGEHRITAVGFGPQYPLADNNLSVQRARNRRVEIIIR